MTMRALFGILAQMIASEIADTELMAHLASIQPDGMSVFVMADGRFRGALLNGTRLVNQMRANHRLGILETLVLGQAMLCSALLIPTMKGREHITFRYDTDGPAAGFSVEADSSGYVRGFLLQDKIPVSAPLESWDLAPFLGEGTLTMSRIIEGAREPSNSSVPIRWHNIAQDLAWYFDQSEQLRTAFCTSIQFDKAGRVTGAGGMFLQAVPRTGGNSRRSAQTAGSEDEDTLTQEVEDAFRAAPSLGQWFAENGNRSDMICGLFREFSPVVAVERGVVFDCPCSEEGFARHIRRLNAAELDDILRNGRDTVEVYCHNCGTVYNISKTVIMREDA